MQFNATSSRKVAEIQLDESQIKKLTPPADIFTSRKQGTDYFDTEGVILRTGYNNKRDWYLFPIREMLDNSVDFLWKYYKGSDKTCISIDIKMDDEIFHLKVSNTNDKNVSVFENLDPIFDYSMKYGSKQDVHIIGRGMLGDAMKQILSLGYVLLHVNDDRQFKDKQWLHPLIIRHNKKEFEILITFDRLEQAWNVKVGKPKQIDFTDTEIELELPVIDEVRDSLTRDIIGEFYKKYTLFTTDISFKFSILDDITHTNKRNKDVDIESILTKAPEKGILHIDIPAFHPIINWHNPDSAHTYKPEEFMRRFHNIYDKNAYSVYDILVGFREGSQIKKTRDNEISVYQLVSSEVKDFEMEKFYYELRKEEYSKPQNEVSLPYTTNSKKRKQILYRRISESKLYDLRDEEKAVYKLVRKYYDDGNGINAVRYPYAFEILAIPFKDPFDADGHGKGCIVIGAVNYSISPKDNYFDGEYYQGDKDRTDWNDKPVKTNIFRVLELHNFYGFANYGNKIPCLILANLITPRRDPLSHDKSTIDIQPFIEGIKEAVKKMATGIQTYRAAHYRLFDPKSTHSGGRFLGDDNSESSVKALLNKFLNENIGR
jgi:hypothetical protein